MAGGTVLLIVCAIIATSYALMSKAEMLEASGTSKGLRKAIIYEIAGGGLLFGGVLVVIGALFCLI